MRMRRKKWAVPELEACPFYIQLPQSLRGGWRQSFARPEQPLALELGCGKGMFASALALAQPGWNFLAVDKISNMLGVCKRTVEAAFGGALPENLRIAVMEAERIGDYLSPGDRVDRLYINFCNPWPKAKHRKHRLTHPRQLLLYRQFLAPGAQLRFKTDDSGLFADTLEYLREAGYEVLQSTQDLHRSALDGGPQTEHETMFSSQGIPIKFLIARPLESGSQE